MLQKLEYIFLEDQRVVLGYEEYVQSREYFYGSLVLG